MDGAGPGPEQLPPDDEVLGTPLGGVSGTACDLSTVIQARALFTVPVSGCVCSVSVSRRAMTSGKMGGGRWV